MNKILRKTMMVILTVLLTADIGSAQAQQVALKTNLLYDATTTPNIGVEMGIGKKQSVQLFYGLNPWKFGHGDDMKYAKHWILNPEYRYWFCQRFNGSFVGIHAFGGEYNAANINLLFWDELKDHRFEGWYVGGGVSYGYQWVLSRHWNFEAAVGLGAAYIDYSKYPCGECGAKLDDGHKIYIGPTKLALSLLYMF